MYVYFKPVIIAFFALIILVSFENIYDSSDTEINKITLISDSDNQYIYHMSIDTIPVPIPEDPEDPEEDPEEDPFPEEDPEEEPDTNRIILIY